MTKVSKKSSTRKYYTMEEVNKLTVEKSKHNRFVDIEGHVYRRLTVISYAGVIKRTAYWFCMCSCGNIVKKSSSDLRKKKGYTSSCGCYRKELNKGNTYGVVHGLSSHPSYSSWKSMRERVLNKNHVFYKHYGGRGISICERWLSVRNFIEDMGVRPKGMSLDRIDNNKGYSKYNCRWADTETQLNNTRVNVFIEYNDIKLTMAQWSRKLGINYHLIRNRVKKGWLAKDILEF